MQKVVTGKLTFHSLKPCNLANCTRGEVRKYFENSYDLNESLYTGLKDDSVFYVYPDRLRLPLIFYYGHTASVYINKLVLAGLIKPEERINLSYEALFETGVDEMSWDDTENYRMGGKFQWPQLDDVIDYRRQVRQLILQLIDRTPLEVPVTKDSAWWAVFMGMEHERIHVETSSVLIRQLPVSMVTTPLGYIYGPLESSEPVSHNPMVEVTATTVTLGKPQDVVSFGWDNDYGRWETEVPAFEASRYLISNSEFLEFVKSGGYETHDFWSKDGWEWLQYRQAKHPTFWVCPEGCRAGCGGNLHAYSHCKPPEYISNGHNSYCNGHSNVDNNGHQGKDEGGGHQGELYRLRCVFDVVAMPWTWPVEVNHHEARAFCAWRGTDYRLAIEAEHVVMRGSKDRLSDDVTDGQTNINLQYGSSTPVDLFPPTPRGFCDVEGNVWEWVEDHCNGLPGFTSQPFYDDYSSPTFDGIHYNILGGSWVSTGVEMSRFARFAFRGHFFQHAGFRVARSLSSPGPDGRVKLPARFLRDPVYVRGLGVQGIEIPLDADKYDYVLMENASVQYRGETEDAVHTSLLQEYGDDCGEPSAMQLITLSEQLIAKYGTAHGRAMHLGCATGRASFALATIFKQVLGLDYSGRFISTCEKLQKGESVAVPCDNGVKRSKLVALPGGLDASRVIFKQLTWLPNEVEFFDFILVTFFERVNNAKAWILRLPEILNTAGLLVVAFKDVHVKQSVIPILENRFQLMETAELTYKGVPTIATVWQHSTKG